MVIQVLRALDWLSVSKVMAWKTKFG